ncbi:hypothetical protein RUMOBE_03865 [Blautia obeum ATCC 29174]|uniref:Uncharacterized protein n=1 Tax=Blautia obeum ATCC 29174 TaxID=411459 RepID=A5ZXV9_9FIRM|nr:hypothetical protein RUMOBE_03865 [Blautia obeum ATCC 29174]
MCIKLMEKFRQKHKKVTKTEERTRNAVYKAGKEPTITGRKVCFTL